MFFNDFNVRCCEHPRCEGCPYDVVCKSLHDLKSALVPLGEMYCTSTTDIDVIRLALLSVGHALKDAGVELLPKEMTNNDHR